MLWKLWAHGQQGIVSYEDETSVFIQGAVAWHPLLMGGPDEFAGAVQVPPGT